MFFCVVCLGGGVKSILDRLSAAESCSKEQPEG